MRRGNGISVLRPIRSARTASSRMAANPKEEGLGRRGGWLGLSEALLIPRDPRGIVLACGFVGVVALGLSALVTGDWIGFAYLIAAGLGYVYIQTRLVPFTVWLAVGAGGVLAGTAGNASGWIVVALAALLAVITMLRPVAAEARRTSRNLEVRAAPPQLEPLYTKAPVGGTSGKLEVSQADMPPSAGSLSAAESSPTTASGANRIRLRTLGSFAIEVDDRDQTQRLHDQPRLEFFMSYLLARKVCAPADAPDRSMVAGEMAPPGLPAPSQRQRLRKTLHALQAALGQDLKGLVKVSNSQVRLDLAGIDVDVLELAEMSARLDRRHGLVDGQFADEIRTLLERTAGGEFLPRFAELEHHVTEGRGHVEEVIEPARVAIADWRADLTVALARHLEASGRAQSSIAYLRSALDQSQGREDLARLLVAAYLQSGQIARADEVRLEYGLS